MSDICYRRVNRVLNWYERRTGQEWGIGSFGYRFYCWLFVKGR